MNNNNLKKTNRSHVQTFYTHLGECCRKKGKMLLLYIFHIRIFLNTCVFKRKYRLNAEQAAYFKSITTVDPTLI
jgi:hypothetical protein